MSKYVFIGLLCLTLVGCRGYRSEKPPIHPNPNLDWQAKYKAQTLATLPPDGTVAWGDHNSFSDEDKRRDFLQRDPAYYQGKDANGQWVKRIPADVSMALMSRGQERFNIYCAACHDKSGSGKSLVMKRGFPPAPDLAIDRIVAVDDGYLFDVITNGVRNMPGYGKKLDPKDRWAVVAYLRALQLNQRARLRDVPAAKRNQLK